MSFLRFLMLLSLIVWLGGLIFFPVVAQTAFTVLPTRPLAGLVVRRSLGILHWMGIVSALVFLVSSLLYSRFSKGAVNGFAARNVLVCLMLALTLISQFAIIPRMDTLRTSLGEIDAAPPIARRACNLMPCTTGLRASRAESCCWAWQWRIWPRDHSPDGCYHLLVSFLSI